MCLWVIPHPALSPIVSARRPGHVWRDRLGMAAQQWSQLFWRMERCAIGTLTARVRAYEVEIRKRYEQRSLPGWNFCTYFCLRESVAFVYAQVR
jgi:hypothetical protein